ncbi:MAG: kynureninase [Acidobacteriota bacterium]
MPSDSHKAGPLTIADLAGNANPLAEHYSRFRVRERTLLSGHSHQAWPDCAFEGQMQAWMDAADWVDKKWDRAFEKANRVRLGYRKLLDDPTGLYSLAESTFDLLVRLISALPLRDRPKLVSTDSEFYSLRRLLSRLQEEGIELVRVPANPADSVGQRLAAATDDRTAMVLTSTVFFTNARIAGDLDRAAQACRTHGALLLLDVYHQLNVIPASLRQEELEDAYVVTAGYKYCQLGEGNAILRFPDDCKLRPIATGWFSEFGRLTEEAGPGRVAYNAADDRFAGATYDPTSHYRAAAVFDFFEDQALDANRLREISQHQVGILCRRFDALDISPELIRRDRATPLEQIGGFLALRSPHAGALHEGLLEHGVFTDFRGEILRLGPAPYLCDDQLIEAMALLGELAQRLPARP